MSAPTRILVIEDSMTVRRLLQLALREYEVEVAPTGSAGVAAAVARPPRLVFLDEHLPDLNTTDVLASMRDNPALRDVPVILLTEAGRDPLAELRERFPNAIGTLPKPFTAGEVGACVEAALRSPPATEGEPPPQATAFAPAEPDPAKAALAEVFRLVFEQIPFWEKQRGGANPAGYYADRILTREVIAATSDRLASAPPLPLPTPRPVAVWDADRAGVCKPLGDWFRHRHGLEITDLTDEPDRLARLTRDRPRLLILNVETTGADELATLAKASLAIPNVGGLVVVATCLRAAPEQVAAWQAAGVSAVLVKPFRVHDLERLLAPPLPSH